MGPLKPYSIGRRPGGYSGLRQKPRGLFGEPAWNSLGEYRRTSGVDSEMPPGMPLDVTRLDDARPRDATLGYEPMPAGHKAAGLYDGLGALARGGAAVLRAGRSPFSNQKAMDQRLASTRDVLNLPAIPPGVGATYMPHVDPAKITSLFGARGRQFWSDHGWNTKIDNTVGNRASTFFAGTPQAPLMDLAARRAAAGNLRGPNSAAAAEARAVRGLTNDPTIDVRPPHPPPSAGNVPPPRGGWAPREIVVPRMNYRGVEAGGIAGVAGGGAALLGSRMGADAEPAATPPAPGPVRSAGGLGDMIGGVVDHVGAHPLAYGLGLGTAGLGAGGLYLHRMRRRRAEEDAMKERLQRAMLAKTGAFEGPFVAIARDCPHAAGVLAYCGDRGYGEAQIRHVIVKAAGVAPDLAGEFERLFGVAAESSDRVPDVTPPRIKSAFGDGYPGDPTVAAPKPLKPTPAATPPPAPAAPLTNVQRAMASANTPAAQSRSRAWRQQLVGQEQAGNAAAVAQLRATPPPRQPAGVAGAARPPMTPVEALERRNVVEGRRGDVADAVGGAIGAPTAASVRDDQRVRAVYEANRDRVVADAGRHPGTRAGDAAFGRELAGQTSLASRPQDDTYGGALRRSVAQVPGALGAMRTLPLAIGRDLARGDRSFATARGNAVEFADPLTAGLGVDPFRAAGNKGTFEGQGLSPAMSTARANPASRADPTTSLAQDESRAWADSSVMQSNSAMAGAHNLGSSVWGQLPLLASMYGMAGMRSPAPAGTTGTGAMSRGGPVAGVAGRVPGLTPAVNAATATRNVPGLAGAGNVPVLSQASALLPLAAQQGNRYAGTGAAKIQAGMAGLGMTGIANQRAMAPAREGAITPEEHQARIVEAGKVVDDVAAGVNAGTMTPQRAAEAVTPHVDQLAVANARAMGVEPDALKAQIRRRLEDGAWDAKDAAWIARTPGGREIASRTADRGGFGSWWEQSSTLDKAAIGLGLPAALLGVLSTVMGGGGLGGILMAVLGLGAAAYGAHGSGLLQGTAVGGKMDSVFGPARPGTAFREAAGTGGSGPPAPAGAAQATGANFSIDPAMRRTFMRAEPQDRATLLRQQLASNPDYANKLRMAHTAWNSGFPGARTATGALIRNQTGATDLKDEEIQALMDAYGG
jgi:hypothetical protein